MTKEELRDYVDEQRTLNNIPYHVYSALIDGIDTLEQEPKTGHWIFVDKAHEHAHCSECDYGNVDLLDGRPHNYCPNCGARMVEPQERSDKE